MTVSRRITLNRKVHAIANRLDISHNELHDFATVTFGVDSMRDLTVHQLQTIATRLKAEFIESTEIRPAQQNKIYSLSYHELKWDSTRIKRFIQKQTGRWASVQDLTRREASKVITGLEIINRQSYAR